MKWELRRFPTNGSVREEGLERPREKVEKSMSPLALKRVEIVPSFMFSLQIPA